MHKKGCYASRDSLAFESLYHLTGDTTTRSEQLADKFYDRMEKARKFFILTIKPVLPRSTPKERIFSLFVFRREVC